ncbi:MAG: hypothetical protein SO188_00605 [Prevotella sp.]|nr:hypothetical protein [Parabacteroides distasonis]MDY4851337.1 hypothetical protein [Prevotella sp.]
MTTMTLNIQDNSIVPHLLEVLSQIKGVTIVHSSNHSYSMGESLSKEEGEKLVRDTLIPAYRDVLEAERKGITYPDISELFSELEK